MGLAQTRERTMTQVWHIIGRGWAGWHAKGINVSSSGGDIVPRWRSEHRTAAMMASYCQEAVEGALVYDASGCEATPEGREAFIRQVCNGPMCDPSLPPDGIKRFSQELRESARSMMPGLGGAFKALAGAAQEEDFTGLDYVGLAVYENILRAIPGIKIGHVYHGEILWEI